jgi:hypothetical protein
VTHVVALADEEPSSDVLLRINFLRLEERRIDRALRHAEGAEEYARQRELQAEREGVRHAVAELMGETA